MIRDAMAHELEGLIRGALTLADDLSLWGTAARLDQALVELTGHGVYPPTHRESDDPPGAACLPPNG